MGKRLIIALSILFTFLFSHRVFAVTNGFEAMSFRPAADGGRFFGIWDSRTFNKGKWFLGTIVDYDYRPFQLTQGGSRQNGILDNTFIQHIYGSAGIIDKWLSVGIDVPVGWWLNYKNPDIAGSPWENKVALGDIRLNLKTNFLDASQHGIGIALVPFIGFPTGKGEYFFGNGGVSGGGSLVIEGKPHEKVSISLNAGVIGKRRYDFRDIEKGNQITGGLGIGIDATKHLALSAEMFFKTRLSGPFQERNETPTDAIGGAKYAIMDTGLVASIAGGAGIIKGSEAPAFRGLLGIGFDSSRRHKKTVPRDGALDEISGTTVHFGFNSSVIENVDEAIAIGRLSDSVREGPKAAVEITGYADGTGSEMANEKLSRQRALKVANYMMLHGVDESKIKVVGRGEENPAADNATQEGRAANRRVELRVTYIAR